MEVLGIIAVICVCAFLGWVGFRIEPHWVSKDGRRFMCNGQRLNGRGEPQARWRETRVLVDDSDRVQVDQKRFLKRTSTFWKVVSRSSDPPRGREVFLLSGHDETGIPVMLALRLPRKSRAVATLEALLRR